MQCFETCRHVYCALCAFCEVCALIPVTDAQCIFLDMLTLCAATGAQNIAYFAGESSAFTFAAAQADSISSCLLQASSSVDTSVQVSCRTVQALLLQQGLVLLFDRTIPISVPLLHSILLTGRSRRPCCALSIKLGAPKLMLAVRKTHCTCLSCW